MPRIPILMAMALTLSGGPLQAQTAVMPSAAEEVMIRVDIGDVSAELAAELGTAVDALPRSVEVPIEVAAVVCEFPVDELEQLRSVEEHLECQATTVTAELTAATGEQMER